ncbi:PREDICTED: RRP15-like protein [Nanorana parkeri]|uniref:RRP15-like protein n=1 Tax=Nanorana parkeri TaxID=125878 RepID=UPI0008548EB0|nr:PREDICTED: RRP15-like protein [Nanorana parkeri]
MEVAEEGAAGSERSSDFADDSFSSDGDVDEPDVPKNESEKDVEPDGDPNKGWADAMAKILNKKMSDKAGTILVKSKVLVKEKERERLVKLEKRKEIDQKRQWEMLCRVKPDVIRDREVERNLQRIATRGVVQLFNAVRTHQSKVNVKLQEAGNSDRKRSKLMSSVSKKDFIDVLRGKESKSEQQGKRESKKNVVKSEDTSEWNILRDDFMMGASMKDWDKNSEDGEAGAPAGEEYSGSDSDR